MINRQKTLKDHPDFSREEKIQLLRDWKTFILSGFVDQTLSPELYNYLVWAWDIEEEAPNRSSFWRWNFCDEIEPMIQFLAGFMPGSEESIWTRADDEATWQMRFDDPKSGDLSWAMYDMMRESVFEMYEAWLDYREVLIDRLADRDVDQYARLIPTATADHLDGYRDEVYEELTDHRDAYKQPVTDELRTKLAQAAKGYRPKPVIHPALFALRQPSAQHRHLEDDHQVQRSDLNRPTVQKTRRQKRTKSDGQKRGRIRSG